MPVPDTSRPCALETARCLGLPYREGFIKNRYIARTFIMPGQTNRKKVGSTQHFTLFNLLCARNALHLMVDTALTMCRMLAAVVRVNRMCAAS